MVTRYERKKKAGICWKCRKKVNGNQVYCEDHRRERSQVAKLQRAAIVRKCPACGERPLGWHRRLCDDCSSSTGNRFKTYQKNWRQGLKLEVFAHYGGASCSCCGETNPSFLTMDHINSNGSIHRREIFPSGRGRIYPWLKKHGFPAGFAVLCFNCNCGRQYNGGICPHKEKKNGST